MDASHIVAVDDVLLSLTLAIVGAYGALECITIARRKIAERERVAWLGAGAFMFGFATIFTMHFIGMAAVEISNPVSGVRDKLKFEILFTLCSIPFVSLGSFGSMYLMRNETRDSMLKTGKRRVLLAGVSMAVGVGMMHYMGLMSMCSAYEMQLNYGLVVVTVIVAVVLCSVGCFLLFAFRGVRQRAVVAVIVGGAVTVVHNVGMQGMTFRYTGEDSCTFTGALQWRVDSLTFETYLAAVSALLCLTVQVCMTINDSEYFRDVSIAVSTRVSRCDMRRVSREVTTMPCGGGGSGLLSKASTSMHLHLPPTPHINLTLQPMDSDGQEVQAALDVLLPPGDLFSTLRDLDEVADQVSKERHMAHAHHDHKLRRRTCGTPSASPSAASLAVPHSHSPDCGSGAGIRAKTTGHHSKHDAPVVIEIQDTDAL